jgi:ATP-dependent Clp protease ATP-binding subunit ClpA
VQVADPLFTTFGRAREIALECGQGRIAPVHLAIAALEVPDALTADVLSVLGVVPLDRAAALRATAPVGSYEVGASGGPDLAYSEAGARVLYASKAEAAGLGHRVVHPLHVLLAILRDRTIHAGRALGSAGLGYAPLRAALHAEVP